jgi:hypothetical protein
MVTCWSLVLLLLRNVCSVHFPIHRLNCLLFWCFIFFEYFFSFWWYWGIWTQNLILARLFWVFKKYILNINPLSDENLLKILKLSFYSGNYLLCCTEAFLNWCNAICQFFFYYFLLGVPFRIIAYSYIISMFSLNSFKVPGLILWSLIHFEMICVQSERLWSTFNLLQVDIQFSAPFVKEIIFYPTYAFWHFCQELDGCICLGLFLGALFHLVYRSFLVPVPCFFVVVVTTAL